MPFGYGNYGGDGGDFVYPIQSELLSLINQSLNPYKEQVTIRQLDLMSPTGDGAVRSSTGRLADPSIGVPPVVETEDPEESGEPGEGEELDENGDPIQSGEPGESDPASSDPVFSDPVSSDPASSDSGTDETGGPGPGETVPAGLIPPVETDGPGDGDDGAADWGETPD